MSAANSHRVVKKVYDDSVGLPWESRLLLSTSYPLDAAYCKRIQIGLRASGRPERLFTPAIELSGYEGEGIGFDFYSWQKFKENIPNVGSYLRGNTEEIPQGVLLNENALNFTVSQGARAIMLIPRTSNLKKNTDSEKSTNTEAEACPSSVKKQKLNRQGIMIRRSTFEELENVINCIDAKHSQLELFEENVGDCSSTLVWHIGHRLYRLPKNVNVNKDLVRQILVDNYRDIKIQMRREFEENVEFLRAAFDVVFSELTTIYFNYIAQTVIEDYFICNSMK